MFKQRILDKTKEIAHERGLSKVMMALKEALRQVTAELTDKEALDVGLERKAWNSGQIHSEAQKRR